LTADRRQGFDLTRPPLMRFTVIRRDDQTSHFVWTHHHLLVDGWSIALLFNDLAQIYRAYARNEEIMLAAPPAYRDYISWLRQQDLAAAEQFWRNMLGNEVERFDSGAKQREANTTDEHRYDRLSASLSRETTAALALFARKNR